MIPEIIEKRFEEYKKDIPKFIEDTDDYYVTYILRPVALISFDYYYDGMSREEFRKIQRLVMDANTDFRKIISFWKLKSLSKDSKTETYVVYTADKNDNKDWFEKNKDCGYIKTVNKSRSDWSQKTGQTHRGDYKGGMPLAIDTEKEFQEYWTKYPFTKIDI